ncbi:MAG: deoxyuridine 5'-triphosphate nucleotidohydrolase [Candidatus Heimdallarchaeota archaeon]|nr:deoxyuridine 5'-triphosphate nucleotidohydrolase [Candidatus Heimdallarchaeota archaeon]
MGIIVPSELPEAIKGMLDPSKQIQQAGIDLTVKRIEKFVGIGLLSVDNKNRVLPDVEEVELDGSGNYNLPPGGYIIRYNESVHVPLFAAGLTLPRSSLMRLGATLHSAVWDPGYKGKGMGLLTVFNSINIQQNSRIAQIIFISLTKKLEAGYSGTYQGEGL